MPRTNKNQTYQNGQLISEELVTIPDSTIEHEEAPDKLRAALAALRAWSVDAKTEAELTAMTAGQRIARQAVIEDRVAKLSRAVAYLVRQQGVSD